ncbi:hypothetical protein NUU61_009636 [Penicillium alfredii]|uniref:Uncharacterized protein n=1 Tax=Penicillium alfredii TaxID=1506179 RepID=A0A9W9EGG2_9EURO|nr:uncharacterized protein NUU61_009636 [Penicillium alfredii]KAJ5081372.1 hypothetical protein NUU61_009636 [Penicillium alfredii]
MATSVRLSPQVQRLQVRSPYVDIYTQALSNPLRSPVTVDSPPSTTHSHPEPKRWQNPGGWGARHMNDIAPFTLWNGQTRKFRSPTHVELSWIRGNFGDGKIGWTGWFIWIETANPPLPVPLTIGCMPVYFVGTGETHFEALPRAPYANPRVPDPCPTIRLPEMQFPTKEQNIMVLTALQPLADVRAILYLPNWTIVELRHGDGRVYKPKSLPGVVAGRTTLYHHEEEPFYKAMKDHTRVRAIDPQQYTNNNDQTLPQDDTNYLQRSSLTPGCRLECGFGLPGSMNEFVTCATSSGVKIRNARGEQALTVAYHGFLKSKDVYHPRTNTDQIGHVLDALPELDVGLVSLTPAASARFTNNCYFQAQPPRMFLEGDQINQGAWSEVDGMSSGLVSLMAYGSMFMEPMRPLVIPRSISDTGGPLLSAQRSES